GETTVTLWFEDNAGGVRRLRYLVKVGANEAEQQAAATEFQRLQTRINELFPNSQVQLIPVADKLVIRGEARDAKEASEIVALVMGQAANRAVNSNAGNASLGLVNGGQGLVLPGLPNFKVRAVLNMMRVPGEHQVMLKVRIAELSRTALRELGTTYGTDLGNWGVEVANLTGSAANISAILNQGDYHLFVNAFASNGYGKILAEPTLVTLNGQPAVFMAGGEFAVPTTVGVQGASAVATTFRGFGTMLSFLPVVTDKDKIRLTVSPSFSTKNSENSVNGIPGLNTRAVTTTVDLREGQWLAIAGMILDQQEGNRGRIPFIGDIPGVGAMFGNQRKKRDETELVVLVSPELVHPLEKDQAPMLLPGMEVTDPTDVAFFFTQQWEGMPGTDHRSTLWPQAKHQEVLSTWQSHSTRRKTSRKFADDQSFFVSGPSGLSK
ncbi:MAG TPA: hypothetical protein PLV92_04880, partial [Pirellulaceae bacterium]|nr:hypothetical protein [Pirellulaceae bacterium]